MSNRKESRWTTNSFCTPNVRFIHSSCGSLDERVKRHWLERASTSAYSTSRPIPRRKTALVPRWFCSTTSCHIIGSNGPSKPHLDDSDVCMYRVEYIICASLQSQQHQVDDRYHDCCFLRKHDSVDDGAACIRYSSGPFHLAYLHESPNREAKRLPPVFQNSSCSNTVAFANARIVRGEHTRTMLADEETPAWRFRCHLFLTCWRDDTKRPKPISFFLDSCLRTKPSCTKPESYVALVKRQPSLVYIDRFVRRLVLPGHGSLLGRNHSLPREPRVQHPQDSFERALYSEVCPQHGRRRMPSDPRIATLDVPVSYRYPATRYIFHNPTGWIASITYIDWNLRQDE